MIPFAKPCIGDNEINAVVDTMKSGWLTMGPKTFQFEKDLAEYVGANYVTAVGSCTAALHLALLAYKIGKNDEVITSPYTFASTGNVIHHVGAKPVFVDINIDTFNIDTDAILEAITPKTQAIIAVDFAGQPCNYKEINEIADDHGLVVIADAAHSFGAVYQGHPVGTLADVTCFSFYATKCITMGEGGAVVTGHKRIADHAAKLRLHGISKDAWKRYGGGSWRYDIEECGWKYNTTDINAAIGIEQLKKDQAFQMIRSSIAALYRSNLKNGNIGFQKILGERTTSNHLFPILVKGRRDKVIEQLTEKGIGTSVHFIPLHLHEFYQDTYGYHADMFPNATWVYNHEISLPIYPGMTESEVMQVIEAVQEVME